MKQRTLITIEKNIPRYVRLPLSTFCLQVVLLKCGHYFMVISTRYTYTTVYDVKVRQCVV